MLHVSPLHAAGLAALGLFAGWLGAVIGIGGGVVVVPAMVAGFGYDIRVAVATSLVAVVATSTAAGSAYVGEGLANMRLGMTLEIATTIGGITGGLVAVLVSRSVIAGLFAVMMVVTAVLLVSSRDEHGGGPDEDEAAPAGSLEQGYELPGRLAGAYFDHHQQAVVPYEAARLGAGAAVSAVAGVVSGMLGVGGGFLKVPAMTLGMRVPIKVAAATSNFMIGVTATSSLFIYFARGYVHPLVAAPLTIGVVAGALAGAHTSARVSPLVLRRILVAVLVFVALQMALEAFGVHLGR